MITGDELAPVVVKKGVLFLVCSQLYLMQQYCKGKIPFARWVKCRDIPSRCVCRSPQRLHNANRYQMLMDKFFVKCQAFYTMWRGFIALFLSVYRDRGFMSKGDRAAQFKFPSTLERKAGLTALFSHQYTIH